MIVSPLDSGKARHPVLAISVKDVGLEVLITSELPKNIELLATEKEVSAHPPESTEEVKPPSQQETPAQLTSEVDTDLQQTAAPPKHPEVTFPCPESIQAQQPILTEVPVQSSNMEIIITPDLP